MNKTRIGLSCVGYEISEWFQDVIKPWKEVKNGSIEGVELVTCASHGVFPETFALGYPVQSKDGSVDLLKNEPFFDNVIIQFHPTYEKDQRNSTLGYLLKQDIDFLFLLDFDEIYTVEQINKILSFVQKNKFVDWFRLPFKNYVLYKGQKSWYRGFTPPRIWRAKVREGIKEYHWDNDITFNDGKKQEEISSLTIPETVCGLIEHPSWWSRDFEVIKRKYLFQTKHYPLVSWELVENGLIFNDEYYTTYNKVKPELIYE